VSLHKEYKIRSRSRLKYDNLAASTFD
jgi:hypothetical protein